jgi:hypothetical protein
MSGAITTHRTAKPFAWSYSKLKNYETCPKRHWHIDIQKDIKEEEGESLMWGNQVHKALADRCSKGVELPKAMQAYEPWAARVVTGQGTILVEQKLAITEEFGPCSFFDRSAWFRGVGDVIKIVGPVALIVDWKTGRIVEDSVQLALMAQCVFAHYPDVQAVRSEFIWLKEDANTTEKFRRDDMPKLWAGLYPRYLQMKNAHDTQTYAPKPGGLCRRFCPVKHCPHHGT